MVKTTQTSEKFYQSAAIERKKKKTCALVFLAKEKQNPCNYSRHMKTNRQLHIYVHVHHIKNHEHYIKSTQSSTTK